jgi:hypothetical protein
VLRAEELLVVTLARGAAELKESPVDKDPHWEVSERSRSDGM